MNLVAVTTLGDKKISLFKVIFKDQDNNIVNVAWERQVVSNVNYRGLVEGATTKESLWIENTTGFRTINVRVDNQNLSIMFDEIDHSLTALYAFIQYHVLSNITNMTLEHDFWYYPEKDVTTGVIVKNTVNIDGANHTVNGNGSAKLFKSSFANTTFKNLNIINGYSTDSGAGIYLVGDNSTIINCNFTNNTVPGSNQDGGAVYLNGDKSFISNCTFENNTASRNGGAIWTSSTNGKIYNSTFISNSAESAGAIWCQGNNHNIVNCSFDKNQASSSAGALAISNGGANSIVQECTFTNNTAINTGGAIYVWMVPVQILNSNFVNNSAKDSGAIYLNMNNIRSGSTISDSYFISNVATTGNGGACIIRGVTVTRCVFDGNIAGQHAGAIYHDYWEGNIYYCNFTKNHANIGGAISTSYDSHVDYCNFINNSAISMGGAAHIRETTQIRHCLLCLNSAEKGGAISVHATQHYSDNLIDLDIYNNSAKYGGGIYFENAGAYFRYQHIWQNIRIYNNTADYGGGIYFVRGNTQLSVSNLNIHNNLANFDGGAIYVANSGTVLTIRDSQIYKNSAINGGAFYVLGAFNLQNTRIYNNTAVNNGGGVYLASDNAKSLSGNTFENNAAYRGSAIFIAGNSQISLTNIKLLNNLANITNIYLTTSQDRRKLLVDAKVEGGDNLMNAIWVDLTEATYDNSITLNNIQYYGVGGLKTTQNSNYQNIFNTVETDECPTVHNTLSNQNISFALYDGEVLLKEYVNVTSDRYGVIKGLVFENMTANKNYTIVKIHNKNSYYNYYIGNSTVSIGKSELDFTIKTPVIYYKENVIVSWMLPDDAHGNIAVNISGNEFIIEDINSLSNYTLNLMPVPGSYTVYATYMGDENYTVAYANCTLFVDRPKTILDINASDAFIGDDAIINFNIISFAENILINESMGNVRAYIGSKLYTVSIVNGTGQLHVSNLTINEYLVIAMYSGDEKYASSDNVTNFFVNGYETDLSIELNVNETLVGSEVIVTVNVNSRINDNPMYLYVDGNLVDIVLTKNGMLMEIWLILF